MEGVALASFYVLPFESAAAGMMPASVLVNVHTGGFSRRRCKGWNRQTNQPVVEAILLMSISNTFGPIALAED